MRKLLTMVIVGLVVVSLAVPALAQGTEEKSFYGQGLITLPSGDFGDIAGTGFGAAIGMRMPHSEVLTFRGELGYITYGSEDLFGLEYSFGMIPILALAEYQFSPTSDAYGLGGIGITMVTASLKGTQSFLGQTVTFDESTTDAELTITLGGGYNFSPKFALEGRFNVISDTSYLSVHGNYRF